MQMPAVVSALVGREELLEVFGVPQIPLWQSKIVAAQQTLAKRHDAADQQDDRPVLRAGHALMRLMFSALPPASFCMRL